MKHDSDRNWFQDGYFLDGDNKQVKPYDDVRLLIPATLVEAGTISVDKIDENTIGTVLFYSDGDPPLLEIECFIGDGCAFAVNYPGDQVLLAKTAEEKLEEC